MSASDTFPNYTKKEVTWLINEVMVDSTDGPGKCTRRFAQTAAKNVRFLSSLAATVRYIARNAFQSARTKGVKRIDFVSLFRV